jgi:hypothetical protein
MTTVSLIINNFQNMEFIKEKIRMKAIEASDEIVCRFCNLNGGLEAAMPFIAYQFKKVGADFSNPTKEELREIVMGLLELLNGCKPSHVVDRERRIMFRWIEQIEDT